MSLPRRSGPSANRDLRMLARAHGISCSYVDMWGRRRQVSDDTLMAVLQALRVPLERPEQAKVLLGDAEMDRAKALPKVIVAWDGVLPALRLSEPMAGRGLPGAVEGFVELEDGSRVEMLVQEERNLVVLQSTEPGLPAGMHRLYWSALGLEACATVISAPRRVSSLSNGKPSWGLFAPLYALSDSRQVGAGDLTCLRELGELTASHGGSFVATLPFLAGYTSSDGATPAGPYSPTSRMWWDEAYLDLDLLPELNADGQTLRGDAISSALFKPPPIGKSMGSAIGPPKALFPKGASLVDLAQIRSALQVPLHKAASLIETLGGKRWEDFSAFLSCHPDLERYGRFRAAVAAKGADRKQWPADWQRGDIQPGSVDPAIARLHCFAQFALDCQLRETASSLRGSDCGLFLDLPLGCRADGYDPWAYPFSFATGATIGAPPDDFFSQGQNWGLPPPHPLGEREAGYPVLTRCLDHSLRYCAALRIDHVMALQRLWWIPSGMEAKEGAYVSYSLEEQLAICSLQALRYNAALVGEDLGTVTPVLRRKLAAHGISGMEVAIFSIGSDPARSLKPSRDKVAYLDTHDTATFAGFLHGDDIAQREDLGLLDLPSASKQRLARVGAVERLLERMCATQASKDLDYLLETSYLQLLGGVLEELGRSKAAMVIVNIEDLWAERQPQNVPGSGPEHHNFSRRAAFSIEELADNHGAAKILDRLTASRATSLEPDD